MVEAGHLCGFATRQRATSQLAALGDALNDCLGDVHVELASRVVVQEEEGLGAADQHVVGAHGHQVLADAIVLPAVDGQLQLGAHPIRAADQHRMLVASRQLAYRREATEMAQGFRAVGGAAGGGDAPHEFVAGIDVHAGGAIGQPLAHGDSLPGLPRSFG